MNFFDRGFYERRDGIKRRFPARASMQDVKAYFAGRKRAADLERRSKLAAAMRKSKPKVDPWTKVL